MQVHRWSTLLNLLQIDSAGRYNVLSKNVGIKFEDGLLGGSIGIISRISVRKPWGNKTPSLNQLRVDSIQVNVDKKRTISYPYLSRDVLTYKGSNLKLVTGISSEPVVSVSLLTPKDCFGALYEEGKIVSYKRDNKQIFGVVESINEEGRIKLRRIYNKTRQKNDFINFKTAHENLIIDAKLLDKLLVLRLKTD